ncbi:MAG: hypothetical protein AMS21_07580 [Gemmatimonas sp. SG8_38_2]|nr:MAG: hypothetical protein AMS21_07580 [Gemmatimonas sp. SG8_38_2]
MRRRYYQLVASLPALPDFRRTRLLPLSRWRLEERLSLLHDDDRAELMKAERLVSWRRQPVSRTTEQIVAIYDDVMATTRNQDLRAMVDFRMNMRTVMVALRLRRRGKGAPSGQWGTGPYTRFIESRWAEPEFGLAAVFPWIPDAQSLLDRGDAMELEKLLMGQSWKRLSQIADSRPFGFEQVFAFAYKWDILHRWLSYDAEKARERFEELIMEVTSDHQDLFA